MLVQQVLRVIMGGLTPSVNINVGSIKLAAVSRKSENDITYVL